MSYVFVALPRPPWTLLDRKKLMPFKSRDLTGASWSDLSKVIQGLPMVITMKEYDRIRKMVDEANTEFCQDKDGNVYITGFSQNEHRLWLCKGVK